MAVKKEQAATPVNRIAEINGKSNGTNGSDKSTKPAKSAVALVVPQLNIQSMIVDIRGITPLVIRAWDQKTMQQLADKQSGTGEVTKSRTPEVPEDTFNSARYISTEGWDGFPASGFKASLVDAVSCTNISKMQFSMTLAKKTFFVKSEGTCRVSGRSLVRIRGDKPEIYKLMQPTSGGGPYMSYRPLYRNWTARLIIEFNACKINAQGVLNLLAIAGNFVGIGEHRPSSKESRTGEFGRWEIVLTNEKK